MLKRRSGYQQTFESDAFICPLVLIVLDRNAGSDGDGIVPPIFQWEDDEASRESLSLCVLPQDVIRNVVQLLGIMLQTLQTLRLLMN